MKCSYQLFSALLIASPLLSPIAKADRCSDAREAVKAAQTSLANAQNKLGEQPCVGPARFDCQQQIGSAQQLLWSAENYEKVACAPSSEKATYPHYVLLTIIYAPPGNQGSVTYEQGSTTGTSLESTSGNLDGYQVQATSPVTNWTIQDVTESDQGTLTEINKTTGFPIYLQSNQDALDHDQDQFWLWVNPELNLYYINQVLSGYTLQPSTNQSMRVIPLIARELKNPSSIPPDKKTYLTRFVNSDYTDILAKDPFFSPTTLDLKRFYRLASVQVQGPDQAGDFLSGTGLHLTSEIVNGQITETKETVQFAILTGFTYENIGIMGGQVGGWDYDNKYEQTMGSTQDIIYAPLTSTIGYYKQYDVYFDSIFSSFAFVPTPDAPSKVVISGKVLDAAGRRAHGATVTVKTTSGQTTELLTNALGNYKFYGPSNADLTVSVFGLVKPVKTSSGVTTLNIDGGLRQIVPIRASPVSRRQWRKAEDRP